MQLWRRLPGFVPRVAVPAALVAAQWGVVAWLASRAPHSGRVYGDPVETAKLHAAARAIVDGHLPHDGGGFLWPVLTAPFAAAGASPSAGLGALVLVQVLVLGPLALLAVVGAVSRLAGRALGAFAGAAWILLPLLAYHYSDYRYRPALLAGALPTLFGLAESTVFPTMVALAVASYLLVCALTSDRAREAAWAGLALSVAIALSGSALLAIPGLLLALAMRRRREQVVAAAAALAPGLLAFGLWYAHAPHAEAPVVHWNWGQFHGNLMGWREYFWSLRVVEWLPIAGTIALCRRSFRAALAFGVWFWLTVLLRGAVPLTFSTGDSLHPSSEFVVLLLPAFPAFAVLAGSLPLLVPRLPARLAPFSRPPRSVDDRA
jgi:hypothetical protein